MQRHSKVEIKKDTVIKTASPELMRVEVEKTRRAHKIAEDCGLFRVPEVLDYDEVRGIAVFERLNGIVPICDAVSWGEEYNMVADKLGKTLAIIHRKLILPSDMIVHLPTSLQFSGNEVFLHGDLSVYNVLIDDSMRKITIIDWQMTNVFGGAATYGTRYFDLVFFIANLYNRPTTQYLFNDPVLPVATKLLEAYFKEAAVEYEGDKFSFYAQNYFSLVKLLLNRNAEWHRRLLLFRSNEMIKNFMHLVPNLLNKKKVNTGE
jgi:tRNA A-37 threonylcarbamoyl transferase component Bud32